MRYSALYISAISAVVLLAGCDQPSPAKTADAPTTTPAAADTPKPAAERPLPPPLKTDPALVRVAGGPSVEVDFAKAQPKFVMVEGLQPATYEVTNGVHQLLPFQGMVTDANFHVKAGDVLRVEYEAVAAKDTSNGARNNFFVGPVTFDKAGKVVSFWQEQQELKVADGPRSFVFDVPVVEGSEVVRLGFHGNWSDAGPQGDGAINIARMKLYKVAAK